MKKLLFVLSFFWISSVSAGDAIYTSFFNSNAVSGYDTVAYFTQGKSIKGKEQFSAQYKQTTWLFSSKEHLALFKANPVKYAPQYGGFCAWAVAAKNERASGDPLLWKVVDGKLYLNYDKKVQNKWNKDIPGFIVTANKNWPDLLKR